MSTLRTARRGAVCMSLLASLLGACANGSSTAPEPGIGQHSLQFESGVRSTYTLELTSRVRLAVATELDLSLTGRLEVTALVSDTREAQARPSLLVSVQQPRIVSQKLDAPAAESLGRELSRGWLVELEAGVVRQLSMEPGASVFARGIARALVSGLQLPTSDRPTWQARERDGTGEYEVEYRLVDAGKISKRKLRYAPVGLQGPGQRGADVTLLPEVLESLGTLRLRDHRLEQLSYREKLKTRLLQSGEVNAETALNLQLLVRDELSELPTLERLRGRLQALPASDAGAVDRHASRLTDASRIGDFTFDSAVSELTRLTGGKQPLLLADAKDESPPARAAREQRLTEYNRAFTALAALIATDAEARLKASEGAQRHVERAPFLIDALIAAETPEAQSSLLALSERGGFNEALHARIVRGLGRIKLPSLPTVETLLGWLGGAYERDTLRRTTAIYGLGSMARHLREAGQKDLAGRIAAALAAGLGRSRDDDDRVDFLRGIANSGDSTLLTSVRPLVDARSAPIRAAALEAMRLMPVPEADRLLAERLRSEGDFSALGAALGVASTRGFTPAVAAALVDVALRSADSQSRLRASNVLGEWLEQHEELREPLRRVSQEDQSDDVRDVARTALAKAPRPASL